MRFLGRAIVERSRKERRAKGQEGNGVAFLFFSFGKQKGPGRKTAAKKWQKHGLKWRNEKVEKEAKPRLKNGEMKKWKKRQNHGLKWRNGKVGKVAKPRFKMVK